ncbi:MAG: hypothetical protein RJQ09_20680 [Cyclobacteriaceae bacterium]
MNKKWNVGLGGTYRSSFGSGEKFKSSKEEATHGGRLFTEYTFFKSFFGHGEFEMLHTNQPDPNSDGLRGNWSEGALIGLGKNYKFIKKIQGSVMLLYNFLHTEPGPYDKPWLVRFGFNWIK